MSPQDLQALNEQIAAMARAALPLDQGLDSLAQDMGGGRLQRVTKSVAADLRKGVSLPEALNRQKHVPSYYPALVAAGVRTGQLPQVLATLGHYSKSISAMRATVIDALLYPAIVFVIGLVIIGLMVFYILPQFETIYQDFGLSLPWVTQGVIGLSKYPQTIAGLLLGLLVFVIVVVLLGRLWSPARVWAARLLYKLPLLGTLVRSARMAAFTDILGLLIEYKVPLPEAFRIAADSCPDPVMAMNSDRVAENLEHGLPLAESLVGRGLVPAWMSWMTEHGEQQSQLALALRQVSSIYRQQVESRITVLRNVLPSFVIVFTAGTVLLLFSIAVMAPMAKLIEGLSR